MLNRKYLSVRIFRLGRQVIAPKYSALHTREQCHPSKKKQNRMKVIGIEIDKKRVICFALEQDSQGTFVNLTGEFRYLEIREDQDSREIKNLMATLHAFFNSINPDAIAIIARQTKGRFASSTYSFKLEGLIQCYDKVDVEFVSPRTLTAYYKKNTLSIPFDNNYQENAVKLASYLLSSLAH